MFCHPQWVAIVFMAQDGGRCILVSHGRTERRAAAVLGKGLESWHLVAKDISYVATVGYREVWRFSFYPISKGERGNKYWRISLVIVNSCSKLSLYPKVTFSSPIFFCIFFFSIEFFSCLSIHEPMYFLFHFSSWLYSPLFLSCM